VYCGCAPAGDAVDAAVYSLSFLAFAGAKVQVALGDSKLRSTACDPGKGANIKAGG